jgi:hypothetical protein
MRKPPLTGGAAEISGDSPKHNAAETVAIGRALTMAQIAPAPSAGARAQRAR